MNAATTPMAVRDPATTDRMQTFGPVMLDALLLVRRSAGWQHLVQEARDVINATISAASGGQQ